jgi:hypothetical protein
MLHVESLILAYDEQHPGFNPQLIAEFQVRAHADDQDQSPSVKQLRKAKASWMALSQAERAKILNGWADLGDDDWLTRPEVSIMCDQQCILNLTESRSGEVQSYLEFHLVDSIEPVSVRIMHGANKATVVERLDKIRRAIETEWEALIRAKY